ncbi:MAG: BREX-1 system adenine-specific DNA-methyltransferase PglX [Selenomonas sp.]|nr:BREX-1 system adenine-specific DNA-methyltransferase PglX [Selenomonas sp.]
MDKNAIKKFAVWARTELITRVTQRAYLYGIDGERALDADQKEVNGRLLTPVERKQRRTLVERVQEKGFETVMDEVAYTWFNRFAALRYMEVNGVLPTKVRVFTSREDSFQPQILDDCLTMDNLEGLNKEIVFELKEKDATDELYKYLLITQCNALGSILPAMFEPIADYTELLLPDNLLRAGSVIEHLVTQIAEDDWRDAVQIIGWLYQYYNSEPKDDVFAALKKNIKITKENIPAATQLFTPDWIVRYMVENSLGRIWIEHRRAIGEVAEADLATDTFAWKYYLPEAEQEDAVAIELAKLRAERKDLRPEDIKLIDPCMGSGHILVYAFDVLVQIYKDAGYPERNIPELILTHNLYGLDIDDRAYQLAYFAVMMRAWNYNHRILRKHIEPNLCAIQESNGLQKWSDIAPEMTGQLTLDQSFIDMADELIDTFHDAKEYGSILAVKNHDYDALLDYIRAIKEQGELDLMFAAWLQEIEDSLPVLVHQAQIMQTSYDVCVTNPPYMGASGMSAKLAEYVKANYANSKSDLFAVFIERCAEMLADNRYQAMITQHAWMFLSSFEKLRHQLLNAEIINMVHLGARAFEEIGGEVVQTTSFVRQKMKITDFKGTYCRLIEPTSQQGKEDMFLAGENRYTASQDNFAKIPGSPIAYWVSNKIFELLSSDKIKTVSTPCIGMRTGDNDRFLRLWYEVSSSCASYKELLSYKEKKWIPYNKGGGYRRWYGMNEYLVNWENNGFEIKENTKIKYGENIGWKISNEKLYFGEGFTWGSITSGTTSFRYYPRGFIFSNSGQAIIMNENNQSHLFEMGAYLNTNIVVELLKILAPTLGCESGYVAKLPFSNKMFSESSISNLSKQNVKLCKNDWDSFETSWDFKKHPLIQSVTTLSKAYNDWKSECNRRFNQLKANEESLNRIFIDIYGLQAELTPTVADKDVTVARIYDTKDDIPESMKGNNYVLTKADVVKSLLSYAVGCIFGRYSLDTPGLAYAGGEFDKSKYTSFIPDEDDIIPLCDDEYFEDDIVARFCDWLKVVYGEEHYTENLQFIADALGGKGTPMENIRSYFLNDFYKDHCKCYQKRPIYWLFDAGRKNSFKALVYIHRYDRDTMARMRTGYVYKQQELYKSRIETYKNRVNTAASQADKNKFKKELKKLQDQFDEIHAYEEKIHHYADLRQEINLDDGVKHNYTLFDDVVAKIK